MQPFLSFLPKVMQLELFEGKLNTEKYTEIELVTV